MSPPATIASSVDVASSPLSRPDERALPFLRVADEANDGSDGHRGLRLPRAR